MERSSSQAHRIQYAKVIDVILVMFTVGVFLWGFAG